MYHFNTTSVEKKCVTYLFNEILKKILWIFIHTLNLTTLNLSIKKQLNFYFNLKNNKNKRKIYFENHCQTCRQKDVCICYILKQIYMY
jgi:hypothetical protein